MEVDASSSSSQSHNSKGGLRQRHAAAGASTSQSGADSRSSSQEEEEVPSKLDRVTTSTGYKTVLILAVSFIPVFGIFVVSPIGFSKVQFSQSWIETLHYTYSLWLGVQFLYNFLMSLRTDSGSCTQIAPEIPGSGHYRVFAAATADDGGHSSQVPTVEKEEDDSSEVLQEALYYTPRFCGTCRLWKPPRSNHCRICDRCVLRLDHHCTYLGKCIGLSNHGFFLLMHVFAVLGVIYSAALCTYALYSTFKPFKFASRVSKVMRPMSSTPPPTKQRRNNFKSMDYNHDLLSFMMIAIRELPFFIIQQVSLVVLVQWLASIIALFIVVPLALHRITVDILGVTTLECEIPRSETIDVTVGGSKKDPIPVEPAFYRHHVAKNLSQVLGPTWWLRLLVPYPGRVARTVALAASPEPGPQGRRWLTEVLQRTREETTAAEGQLSA